MLEMNEKLHNDFIFTCSNLMALALGIPQNTDRAAVAEIATKAEAKPYAAKKVKVEEEKKEG